MTYIICFTISLLFFRLAERSKKSSRNFFAYVAIMIPCLLAAFRADTIGTDVNAYLIPMFNLARDSHNIAEFFSDSWMQLYTPRSVNSIEIGFSLLVYIVAKLFSNLYVLQFFVQLLSILPVYTALANLSDVLKRKVIVIGMLVYFSMCYNYSLNLMRQYIAIGFLVLAFSYLITENRRKFFLFEFIALTFHYASISGLVIFVVNEYILGNFISFRTKITEYKASKYRTFIVIVASILAVYAIPAIVNLIIKFFGNIKYIGYIDGAGGVSFNQIILRLPLLVILAINFKRLKYNYGSKVWLLLTSILLIIIVAQLVNADGSASSSGAYRIVLYFSCLLILIVPIMYATPKQRYVTFIRILIVSYFLIWWLYYFGNTEECTVPYLSIWS